MEIDLLREKLITHYEHSGELCRVHELTDDEVIRLAKDLNIFEANDDSIDGIPFPIFLDLFS